MLNKKFILTAMIVIALLLVVNQWQIMSLKNLLPAEGMEMPEQPLALNANNQTGSSLATEVKAIAAKIVAQGVPPVYGAELNVSFDQAAAAISILSQYEQDTRTDKLTGQKLERYIKIGQSISCEFCCTAKTMVFPDGRKACGCAHSAAMRGVAAYLLDNYGQQMSDNQILTEVSKWKSVFFPGPTVNKYLAQSGQGNQAAGLQQQVGGC